MRYCLIALIIVMSAMYFVEWGGAYPTTLPAPTPEEQRGFNLRGLRNLTTQADMDTMARLDADMAIDTRAVSARAVAQSKAFTLCNTRAASNLADVDLDL